MIKRNKIVVVLRAVWLGIVLLAGLLSCDMQMQTPNPNPGTTSQPDPTKITRGAMDPVWQYKSISGTPNTWTTIDPKSSISIDTPIEIRVTSTMQDVQILVSFNGITGQQNNNWVPYSDPIAIVDAGTKTIRALATSSTGTSAIVNASIVSRIVSTEPPSNLRWEYRESGGAWTALAADATHTTSASLELRPLADPASAAIHYTLGTSEPADPSTSSNLYRQGLTPIRIDNPGTTIYKAKAFNAGMETGVVKVTITSNVEALTISLPTFSKPNTNTNSYLHNDSVIILPGSPSRQSLLPRTVYYTITTNGSEPSNPADSSNSARILYTGPVVFDTVSTSGMPTRIKAVSAIGTGPSTLYSMEVVRAYNISAIPDMDVDDDNDGLIEIRTLEEFNNIRFNLKGTSYKTSDADSGSTAGAVTTATTSIGTTFCDQPTGGVYLCGYELMADINFDADGDNIIYTDNGDGTYTIDDTGNPGYDSGMGWLPIGSPTEPFQATLNGNGHTINGLAINRPGASNLGLFAVINPNQVTRSKNDYSKVINLKMTRIFIRGQDNLGGLYGRTGGPNFDGGELTSNRFPTAAQIRVEGEIIGRDNIGLLAGQSPTGSYFNSSGGAVRGRNNVGGLIGYIDSTTGGLRGLFSNAEVVGNNSVGGLIGYLGLANLENSYASGNVEGTGTVGGLIGRVLTNNDRIKTSYASGRVSSTSGPPNATFGRIVGTGETIMGSRTQFSNPDDTGTFEESYGLGTVGGSGNPNAYGAAPSGVNSPLDFTASLGGSTWQTEVWDFNLRVQGGGPAYKLISSNRIHCEENVNNRSIVIGRTVVYNCGSVLPGQGTYEPPFAFSSSISGAIPLANQYNFSESTRTELTAATNQNPLLTWSNVPEGTVELVLLMHNPANKWLHWVLSDISPGDLTIPAGTTPVSTETVTYGGASMKQGLTSYSSGASGNGALRGYYGPDASDPRTGTFSYIFTLYALNANVTLPDPAEVNYTRFGLYNSASYYDRIIGEIKNNIIDQLSVNGHVIRN